MLGEGYLLRYGGMYLLVEFIGQVMKGLKGV